MSAGTHYGGNNNYWDSANPAAYQHYPAPQPPPYYGNYNFKTDYGPTAYDVHKGGSPEAAPSQGHTGVFPFSAPPPFAIKDEATYDSCCYINQGYHLNGLCSSADSSNGSPPGNQPYSPHLNMFGCQEGVYQNPMNAITSTSDLVSKTEPAAAKENDSPALRALLSVPPRKSKVTRDIFYNQARSSTENSPVQLSQCAAQSDMDVVRDSSCSLPSNEDKVTDNQVVNTNSFVSSPVASEAPSHVEGNIYPWMKATNRE